MVAMAEERNSQIDVKRLDAAFKHANRVMEHPRKMFKEYIKRYVGYDYTTHDRTPYQIPLNMIQLDVGIKVRQLAPTNPQAMVSTWKPSLKPLAKDLELALNKTFNEVKLGKKLTKGVLNAMFGFGVFKVGLDPGTGGYGDGEDEYVNGELYVDVVSPLDFVFDPGCTDVCEDAKWMACRNRLSEDFVRNNQMYDPAVRRQVVVNDPTIGEDTEQRILWGGDELKSNDLYGRIVDVWYFWFPEEKRVAAYATTHDGTESALMNQPLWEDEWQGPEGGPYRILSFIDVPDSPLPVPPASQIRYLDEKMNTILQKVLVSAEATKKVIGVINADQDTVNAIKQARHGEAVALSQSAQLEDMLLGGVDQTQLALGLQVKQLISYAAGNMDIQGGLNNAADTLGQERLMGASASKQIDDMQRRVMDITQWIMKDLGFYLWSDPLLNIPITKSVPGVSVPVNRILTPEDLEGEWDDFDITIQPYSAVNQTPASQLQMWMQMLQGLILPNQQLLMQQGATVDMVEVVHQLAHFANLPDIVNILKVAPQMTAPGNVETHVGQNPNKPNGQYERVSTSKKSPEAKEQEQIQSMMAGATGGQA
jgi:hypothetical protein